MNLNKKVSKFTNDGIPAYNKAFNELADLVNWINGIRVINGKQIAESDQGPVIDLSPVNSTQSPTPWAVDPDGNPAGWALVTLIDTNTGNFYDLWVWAGSEKNVRQIPWWYDPSNIQAHWLSGPQGELWGTGAYPIGPAGKYQQIKWTLNNAPTSGQTYPNPSVWTGTVQSTPIVPPSSPPPLFIKNLVDPFGDYSAPEISVVNQNQTGPLNPGPPISFTYQLTYDGTVFLSGSASANFNNPKIYIHIDSTGWVFNPQNVPGYTFGDNCWVYLYNGPVSTNTNPVIQQTFTWTPTSLNVAFNPLPGILYTG